MTISRITQMLDTLHWDLELDDAPSPAAASGAFVCRVRSRGHDAVLKLTEAGHAQGLARHELAFYRTMADLVPVDSPSVLDWADRDDFTALLLSAHNPGPGASDWKLPDWLELTRQLAALHATTPPQPQQPAASWIREVLQHPPTQTAVEYWTSTAAREVPLLLGEITALATAFDEVPDGFIHGDCHVDNLLRHESRIIWADWQAYGLGNPAGEVAFLWSRAHADGAEIPYDAMIREYTTTRAISPATFPRAVLAAEIGILLFGWPQYAHYRNKATQHRLTARLRLLSDQWLA